MASQPPKPENMTDEEEIAWAIDKLSKCIKRRKSQQAFADVVEAAKAQFLDPRAKAAGAENGNAFYSIAALTIRSTIIKEPVVRLHRTALFLLIRLFTPHHLAHMFLAACAPRQVDAALSLAWTQVTEACHAVTGLDFLTKREYSIMMR